MKFRPTGEFWWIWNLGGAWAGGGGGGAYAPLGYRPALGTTKVHLVSFFLKKC